MHKLDPRDEQQKRIHLVDTGSEVGDHHLDHTYCRLNADKCEHITAVVANCNCKQCLQHRHQHKARAARNLSYKGVAIDRREVGLRRRSGTNTISRSEAKAQQRKEGRLA
jgi:hypothetical protein